MTTVPSSLRKWFIFHFIANGLAGLQLLFVPAWFLHTLGIEEFDLITPRLVGAALLGIGIASLLVRKKGLAEYKTLLFVKAIWSGIAIFGLVMTLVQYGWGAPEATWFLIPVFVGFHSVWDFYLYKLRGL